MKQLFDYLPVVVFFGLYFLTGRDIMLATWGIIAATTFQVFAGRLIFKRWNRLHLGVFAVTLVFGGLTLALRDDVFIKWRPSIISFALAGALLIGQLLRERNLLQRLCEGLMTGAFGSVVPMARRDWVILNLAFVLYFIFIGLLNLYIAFNFSTDFWVNFKLFGFTAIQMVFYVGAFVFFYKRIPEADRKRLFHSDSKDPKKKDDDAVRDHQ
ncbi:inner membrane-spanning protein YciB [Alloalcanivorax mobilis]|uniref:inner membrane-spanning protein YciB n=1 Tax=Alloalcanivorax mobilis TaxID=2019569 RepID=UPI000B5B21A7|nr:inner membrane-spanning protein YciB [Alloalcanivorax mobilis]ASK33786.1 septation protein A [Alcanivorax sp. N3-2A]|tara:strand:+ start:17012 stop:17647 length:636 start_codon:yes stop_codon:yes gene_type:complete